MNTAVRNAYAALALVEALLLLIEVLDYLPDTPAALGWTDRVCAFSRDFNLACEAA